VSLGFRLLLILVSAGLYGLSFPPYGAAALAWFALVPFLIALRGLSAGKTLLLAWISGLTMAYAITDFLPESVATYYGQGVVFGLLLFVASVTVMCCLSHMLFAVWYRWPGRSEGLLSPLVVGAAWVVAEFVRGDLEGNPWGTMGYTQARVLPLVQVAEWTGVYGVSFVLVAMNAALADLVVQREALRGRIARVAVVAAVAVSLFVWGDARLAEVEAEPGGDVPIAVVQGNVDLGARWREELYGENLEDYLRQTRDSTQADRAALVFWPENAVTFFLADEPLYRYSIGRVLSETGAQLVTGGPYTEPGPPRRYYNSTFLLAPSGEVAQRYDKRILLPFAEYYPAWLAAFSKRGFEGVREFTPGRPSPPLPTAAGPAAIVTCNEALFPRTVSERVAEGGGFLVNLANDGWLGVHRYSDRVLDMVAFRSVEQRQYMVRASSSGGSAIIAPSGRVLAKSEPFAAEVLRGEIRSRREGTPYGRFGDVFVVVCAVVVGVASLRAVRS
jgi:apolipoprotein N-acyltransferase